MTISAGLFSGCDNQDGPLDHCSFKKLASTPLALPSAGFSLVRDISPSQLLLTNLSDSVRNELFIAAISRYPLQTHSRITSPKLYSDRVLEKYSHNKKFTAIVYLPI